MMMATLVKFSFVSNSHVLRASNCNRSLRCLGLRCRTGLYGVHVSDSCRHQCRKPFVDPSCCNHSFLRASHGLHVCISSRGRNRKQLRDPWCRNAGLHSALRAGQGLSPLRSRAEHRTHLRSSSNFETLYAIRHCAAVNNSSFRYVKRGQFASRGNHEGLVKKLASRCAGKNIEECGGAVADNNRLSVLDKYLIGELLPPLLYGAAAFTFLGISIGAGPEVMALAEKVGLSVRHILLFVQILVLRLPSYIGLALPMASLLASMLAFGRLGVDRELTALQAGGIRTSRMLRPALVLFVGVTALHLLLAEGITPRANRTAKEATSTAIASVATISDSGKAMTGTSSASFSQPLIYPKYRKGGLAHLLYAHGFDGKALLRVTLVEMQSGEEGQAPITKTALHSPSKAVAVKKVVMAEEATWDELQRTWVFTNGCEYVLGEAPQSRASGREGGSQGSGSSKVVGFQPQDVLPVSLQAVRQFRTQCVSALTRDPLDLAEMGVNKSFDDMTIAEASRLLDLMQASRNVKESRKLQVKIQQRISLPFASVIFGLVGTLLSIRLPREQKLIGLALTLAIVFGYYSVSVFGSLVGQLGYVSPILGAWLPNLVGALLASVLLMLSA